MEERKLAVVMASSSALRFISLSENCMSSIAIDLHGQFLLSLCLFRNNEKSGSFVKAKLLTPSVTATEAVTDKYGHIDDESAGVDEDEAFLYQPDSDRVIKVEVVGMRSINDLQW